MGRSATDAEIEQVWNEFWVDIVMPNGVLDIEQVKRELFDLHFIADNVPRVYAHVTGGHASKPNTDPSVINSLADDETNRAIEDALDDMREEAVLHGAATWSVDESGKRVFEWKQQAQETK